MDPAIADQCASTDDGKQAWKVLCLDKKSGRILWEKTAHTGTAAISRHPKATHANTTAATDGKHVVAFFGSEGLYCYNLDGKLIWKKGLGRLDSDSVRHRPSAARPFAQRRLSSGRY